jgi:hypothetical protein
MFRRKGLVKSVAIVGITLAYLASATGASATKINGWVYMGNFPFPGKASGIDVCLKAGILSPGTSYFSPVTKPLYPHNYAAFKTMTPTAQHNCSEPAVTVPSGQVTLVMEEWKDSSVCTTVSSPNNLTQSYYFIEGWSCGNPSGLQSFHTEVMAKIQCSWSYICSTHWIGSGNESF